MSLATSSFESPLEAVKSGSTSSGCFARKLPTFATSQRAVNAIPYAIQAGGKV